MSAKGRPERELLPLGGKARSAKGVQVMSPVDSGPRMSVKGAKGGRLRERRDGPGGERRIR
jgi:hypothetical protein